MSEPTTDAGRRLLARLCIYPHDDGAVCGHLNDIAAIEAEARAAERERIAKAVEAIDDFEIRDSEGYRINSAEAMRLAVLAIVREQGE